MDVTIRRATPGDAGALAALVAGLGLFSWMEKEDPRALERRVARHLSLCLSDESHTLLVAESGDGMGVIGYIAVHWLPYLILSGPEGNVSELFIDAKARGAGVGARLLAQVREEATKRGCSRLSLLNRKSRESYQRGFYGKRGFEERAEMANFILPLPAAAAAVEASAAAGGPARGEDRWDGGRYRDNSDPQERFALKLLERLALKGDERVLDVGCGDGRITAEIARRVPGGRVLGVDASANMIAACTEAHRERANLSFRVADAAALRTDERFDAAVSFSALHWVVDLRRALGCIHDALKPGGRLVIGMGGGHQREIADVFRRERWRAMMAGRGRAFHGRTREELAEALRESGFSDVVVDAIEGARPYTDEPALLDWIMAWLPHATGLAGEMALEFGREIVANVRGAQPPGQGLVLRSTMLAANATRPAEDRIRS